MSTASIEAVQETSYDHADYEDQVLRFNIKMLLAASPSINQTSLAKLFHITTAGMSYKTQQTRPLIFQGCNPYRR